MALRVDVTRPAGDLQMLGNQVSGMEGARGNRALFTAGKKPDDLQISTPHTVYVSTAEQAEAGDVLTRAQLSGWRYLIFAGGRPLSSAEIDYDPESREVEFSHLSSGPYVEATVDVLREAAALDQVKKGDYELRYLKVPGLSVIAYWLRDLRKRNDLILPLLPEHDELKGKRVFSRQEFSGAVETIAKARLEFKAQP
jgi:hypothetical protein